MRRLPPGALTIPIPEGVDLTFVTAGAASRFFAWFIDTLVIAAVLAVAQRVLAVAALFGSDWQAAVLTIAYFVISTGYAIYLEWRWGGQTVGKRLCSLKVVDAGGLHLSFAQVVVRNLLRALDALPFAYLVGGTVAFFNRRCMRLGDLAGNTVVIQISPAPLSIASHIENKYNSLASYPHLIARIRHSASRVLIEVAREALVRRDRFAPQERLMLFREIRSRFSEIARFPEAATDHLTDEQYVRNVVAALFEIRNPLKR